MQFLPLAESAVPKNSLDYSPGDCVELADFSESIEGEQEVCCGGAPPEPSNPFERPGYLLQNYVRAFIVGNGLDIPLVKTELGLSDHLGTAGVRLGFSREKYTVAPGLYGIGNPVESSPVLVTANYKLTFDQVRSVLTDYNCWIVVLDTCGVNVWCAAGKPTFSTDELVRQIETTDIQAVVSHRNLIVPQLGAPGVAAQEVKLKTGFRVIYGPVHVRDLPEFLDSTMTATPKMRTVTFSLAERATLIPVELVLYLKKIWWLFPVLFLLSIIHPDFMALDTILQRSCISIASLLCGGVFGAVCVPLLLPWIPGKSFSFKGAIMGLLGGAISGSYLPITNGIEFCAFVSAVISVSSYLAMNFTGSTPFTSPSGVEKEMKIAIPLQALLIIVAFSSWIAAPFTA